MTTKIQEYKEKEIKSENHLKSKKQANKPKTSNHNKPKNSKRKWQNGEGKKNTYI